MKELIPEHFENDEEAGNFWDIHSAADYWDGMEMNRLKIEVNYKDGT